MLPYVVITVFFKSPPPIQWETTFLKPVPGLLEEPVPSGNAVDPKALVWHVFD